MSKTESRPPSRLRDWHREDVKAAIRKKEGLSMAAFAKLNGYENPSTFYNVFKMPYPKIERIIADYLDVSPSDIWPTRYANRSTPEIQSLRAKARVA